MNLQIPFEPLAIVYLMQAAGYECYIVGGAVRDLVMKKKKKTIINDWDFATNAKPEEIQKVLKESYYENEFGCVGITHENLLESLNIDFTLPANDLSDNIGSDKPLTKQFIDLKNISKLHPSLLMPNKDKINSTKNRVHDFEITTYRSNEVYQNFRKPETLSWGTNIHQDLERRDFTINALALNVYQEFLEKIFSRKKNTSLQEYYLLNDNNAKIIDEHDSLNDLSKKRITAIGDPDNRFNEDALRMLRAIRFACQLDMSIADNTLIAIKNNSGIIKNISAERIRDELMKLLVSDKPSFGIKLMQENGLLKYFLPELEKMIGIDQGGHHTTDVWIHSLGAVDHCPSKDPIVKLSALLHDVGKPSTYNKINDAISFYNHEVLGSRLAVDIAKRLRLSKNEQQRIFILVRYHMFFYQPHHTDSAVRRIMRKVRIENLNDIIAIREGDRLGSGSKVTSWRLEELKKRMEEQLHQPIDLKDLKITGKNLVKDLKLKPGPSFKEILNKLLELVLDDPSLNTKKRLLKEAKKIHDSIK